jgi:hypothetical protein
MRAPPPGTASTIVGSRTGAWITAAGAGAESENDGGSGGGAITDCAGAAGPAGGLRSAGFMPRIGMFASIATALSCCSNETSQFAASTSTYFEITAMRSSLSDSTTSGASAR